MYSNTYTNHHPVYSGHHITCYISTVYLNHLGAIPFLKLFFFVKNVIVVVYKLLEIQ